MRAPVVVDDDDENFEKHGARIGCDRASRKIIYAVHLTPPDTVSEAAKRNFNGKAEGYTLHPSSQEG